MFSLFFDLSSKKLQTDLMSFLRALYLKEEDQAHNILHSNPKIAHLAEMETAIHFAAQHGQLAILKTLFTYNKNLLNLITDWHKPTALLLATLASDVVRIQFALAQGADVNYRNRCGHTALFYAVSGMYFPAIQCLVEANSQLNHIAASGISAPELAIHNLSLVIQKNIETPTRTTHTQMVRHSKIVNYLISIMQIELAKCADNWTLLHWATQSAQLGIVNYLLQQPEFAIHINCRSGDGRTTPLILALQCGHLAIVDCLLKKGASTKNIYFFPHETKSIMPTAIQYGYFELVKLLLEKGKTKVEPILINTALEHNHTEMAAYLKSMQQQTASASPSSIAKPQP
jgi:ankyrin repeat protein